MAKTLKWTLFFHLVLFGPTASALLAGMAYPEMDSIRAYLASAQEHINAFKDILRVFAPWI
jgi:hypothetical protein